MQQPQPQLSKRRSLRQALANTIVWSKWLNVMSGIKDRKKMIPFLEAVSKASNEDLALFDQKWRSSMRNMLSTIRTEKSSPSAVEFQTFFRNLRWALNKLNNTPTIDIKMIYRLIPNETFGKFYRKPVVWHEWILPPTDLMSAMTSHVRRGRQQVLYTGQNIKKIIGLISQAKTLKQLNNAIPAIMIQYNKKQKIPEPTIRQAYRNKVKQLNISPELSLAY